MQTVRNSLAFSSAAGLDYPWHWAPISPPPLVQTRGRLGVQTQSRGVLVLVHTEPVMGFGMGVLAASFNIISLVIYSVAHQPN